MQRRRQTRRAGRGRPVLSDKPAYPPPAAPQAEGISAAEAAEANGTERELPFRVELPSRRWLELAAGNGAASSGPQR